MADEPINPPAVSDAQQRITDLSTKVKNASDERDAAKALAETAAAEKATMEKERDFYATFTDTVATNPGAKEHKDEILAKVKSGYTIEDATFAVLGKAGKLGNQVVDRAPHGGSADTALPSGGQKTPGEMTQAERRAELIKAQDRGDISLS